MYKNNHQTKQRLAKLQALPLFNHLFQNSIKLKDKHNDQKNKENLKKIFNGQLADTIQKFKTQNRTGQDQLANMKTSKLKIQQQPFKSLDQYLFLEDQRKTLLLQSQKTNKFQIRRVKTPSVCQREIQTSNGSSEKSVEMVLVSEQNVNNATETQKLKKIISRPKSCSRQGITCRIAVSKKLPFDVRPQSKKRGSSYKEQNLDISVIEKVNDPFWNMESMQNIILF